MALSGAQRQARYKQRHYVSDGVVSDGNVYSKTDKKEQAVSDVIACLKMYLNPRDFEEQAMKEVLMGLEHLRNFGWSVDKINEFLEAIEL